MGTYVEFLAYLVLVPVLIAVFLYVFTSDKVTRLLAILFQALMAAASFYLVAITRGTDYVIQYVGATNDYLSILLYANDMTAIFTLLTTVIFLVIAIYSFNQDNTRMFWLMLFIWQATLIGIFLTRDLFNIFVMFEVAGLIVTMLVLFKRKTRSMYEGMFYLLANLVAVSFFLFGLGYLYMLTGELDIQRAAYAIAEIYARGDGNTLILPYALIMTAIAFKCASLPMSIWVPKAHGAPGATSGTSGILSGVYIKVAVYLFIRLQEMFAPIANHNFFLIVSIATAFVGAIMAMSNSNAKVILAYHTVSQVGFLMIGLAAGLGGMSSAPYIVLAGGLFHIVAHAIFKSALFLTLGIIKNSYGTLDAYVIRGVFKRMPVVGIAMGIAILGIMGAPFFIGSISKYFIGVGVDPWLEWVLRFAGLATIISFIKYGAMLFGKDPGIKGYEPKPDNWRQFAALAWASLCIIGGVLGVQAMHWMFGGYIGYDLTYKYGDLIIQGGYHEKTLWWIGSVIVGYGLYKFVVTGVAKGFLKKVGAVDMGFKTIVGAITLFFGALLVATGLM